METVVIKEAVMQMVNATGTYMDSATNLFGVFAMVMIAVGIIAILLYVSSSIENFRKFKRIIKVVKFLYNTIIYFVYGGLTVIVIGGPCILGYYAFQSASENVESIIPILKTIGTFALIFIGFALLGFVMKKKVWSKLFKFHKMEREQRQFKNQIEELPTDIN